MGDSTLVRSMIILCVDASRHFQTQPAPIDARPAIPYPSAGDAANESTIMADEPKWTYTLLPPALLPLALRAAPSGPRGGKSKNVGAAAAMRLAAFVRGALGARGERAASAAIESKLQKRVVHLENASTQTAAQSAGVRAARKAASSRQGLSGKQCKKMVRPGFRKSNGHSKLEQWVNGTR